MSHAAFTLHFRNEETLRNFERAAGRAIGMCLTGGIVLSLMIDGTVLASVVSFSGHFW